MVGMAVFPCHASANRPDRGCAPLHSVHASIILPLSCPLCPQTVCSISGSSGPDPAKLEEAVRIRDLLGRNTEELSSVVRALNGEYILPEAGGDLLRDGAGASQGEEGQQEGAGQGLGWGRMQWVRGEAGQALPNCLLRLHHHTTMPLRPFPTPEVCMLGHAGRLHHTSQSCNT